MSAFILSSKHINTMVNYLAHHSRYHGGDIRVFHAGEWHEFCAEEAGFILAAQNVASVDYRYSEANECDYHYGYTTERDPLIILKACACYDCQSCETPNYYETMACALCDLIRHAAIDSLPGYDSAAGWAIEETLPASVAAPRVVNRKRSKAAKTATAPVVKRSAADIWRAAHGK